MEIYYHEKYRDKTEALSFEKMDTKYNVSFAWTGSQTNIKDTILGFDYTIKFTASFTMDIVTELSSPKFQDLHDAPNVYFHMYFSRKTFYLNILSKQFYQINSLQIACFNLSYGIYRKYCQIY